jgi:filamentous hemagglutinin family protein
MKRHASMNRVYRLLWSETSGAWIAVAETARSRGKSACSRRLLAASLLLVGPLTYAAPGGGQIVSGSASISQAGTITTIRQSSPTLSLNWKTFNIAPQETVDFLQPSTTSIAVNRIFDSNGSEILGHLNANGQLYLINANGILFGQGAQVNVAGLVASTLNVSDLAMNGATRSFSGDSTASIVNAGSINASSGGYVALVGNHVSNQGTITAQMGSVVLAAGSTATLTFSGNSLLHMQVDQSVMNSVIENGGLIRADGGQVIMTAGAKNSLLASVVNNSGVIQARSMENQDGTIVLLGGMQAGEVIVGGALDVSSASGAGGQIVASAEAVSVASSASVQATGATGGGTIAIGAGWEGGGGIDQATSVYVSNTATLNASATARGNGGTISVRSDVENPNSTTRVYGTVLAHGGASGGNGGRIETSGRWLDVTGSTVNASAAHGVAGEWLLDPWNVIIAATGTGVSGTQYVPTADSTITASSIDTVLNAGNNITITTGTNTGGSLGDITVNAAIAKTSGATSTLVLQAADSIIINQPITNTSTSGALNLTLDADNQNGVHDGVGVIILNNSLTTKGGFIAFGDGTTYNPGGSTPAYEDGGDVYVGGSSPVTLSTAGGAVAVHGQLIIADTGGLSINSTNGNVTVDGLIDSGDSYAFVASANVTWTAAKLAAASGTGANVGDTYLATITSRLENAVAGSAAGYVASWLGAERVVGIGTDAVWRWVTGPEGLQNNGQGLEFFTQNGTETGNDNGTDKGGTAIGGAYVNWNPATPEPNNSGGANLGPTGLSEYVMQFVGTAGQWNDLAPTNALTGYVKETNLAPSALNISAGTGVVTFSQALGSNKPLASINISAQTIALPSPAVLNTIGAQTYTGQVTVGGTNVNLLTVSANNLNTFYGGAVPALSTIYSGFVNGDTVASLTTAATETLSATAQPVVGSYPITPSGVVDSNYFIVYNPALLIVNPATLTITASSASKTYDSANPALTVGYSGFEYGDTLAGLTTAATASTTAVMASNVGAYPTNAAGAVASANYTIAYVAGTLTVNPITLTVSGLSGTGRAYNSGLVDALSGTGTLAGLVAGQTLTLANTNGTLGAANAGSETVASAITLVNGTGGGLAGNYVLTQPTLANVTITPATLTISGYSGTGRAYNASATDALSGAGTLSGLVNGDTLTLGDNTNGTLASANAGSEAITTAITLANGTGLASNYTLTQPTLASVTITQAPLTVSGFSGTARVYNGSPVDALAGNGVLAGLSGLETLTLGGNAGGTLASANAGSEAITTAITLGNGTGGGLAANYVLTQPTLANVTITPASLTVSGLSGTGRAYNGSLLDALSGSAALTGVVVGQTLTLGNTNGTLGSSNAGSEPITSAITLGDGTGGGLAANYMLTQPTLANVTITPAPLTVSATTVGNKVYDGTTAATLTGAVNGVFAGDAVTLLPAGSFGSKDVGTGIAVTAADTLTGTKAFDYTLTQPTGLTANITPLAITVSATGADKVYDGGLNDAATLTSAGLIAGDTVTFSDTSAVFGDKNVGNAKPIAVSGISASGPQAFDYTVSNTTASSTANITQLGSVAWIGPATGGSWSNPANWTGGAIPDLSNVANVVIPNGDNVTFDASVAGPVNINQLSSGGLTVDSGTLNVAAALNLTNFAQIGGTVGGSGSFTVTNSFTQTAGQIALSGGAVSINQATGNLSFANISAGSAILNSGLGAVVLGNLATTGNLIVAAEGGGVTQSTGATLTVGGTTGLAASNGGVPADISLTNAGNVLVAAVSAIGAQVRITDAVPLILAVVDASGDLLVNSTGGLDLGTSTVGGTLVANSGNGNVIQEGAMSVAGTSNIDAGSGNVQLNNPANILAGTVTTSGQRVSLTNAVPLNLGAVTTGGNLVVNSNGALDLGTLIVGGNLTANSANGNVTQDGLLSVGGSTDIVAGTGSIQLNNPGNVFQGALTTSGSTVGVVGETNALALEASIDSAVSQLESDGLSTNPGNPPDALNLSPTVSETRDGEPAQVTMNIGPNGPQLQILNGGMRLPDNSITVARRGN